MIYYIFPEYVERVGDCCRVATSDGDTIYQKSIKSVLNSIYKERYLDIREIKHKCSKVVNQNNLTPMYVSSEEILIPMKVRNPRIVRDGGYGYINALIIDEVEEEFVRTKNKDELLFLDNKRIIIKRIKMARIIKEAFSSRFSSNILDEDLKNPATKEDVMLLLSEIMKIKRNMERKMQL